MRILLVLVLILVIERSNAQPWTNLPAWQQMPFIFPVGTAMELSQEQAPSKTLPDPDPAHAKSVSVHLAIASGVFVLQTNDDTPVVTNTCVVMWDPYNVFEIVVYDGTNSGSYNESNVVLTAQGTVNSYVLNTTNPLPIYINAIAVDQFGDASGWANEIGFNGWTFYSPTNWFYVTNNSGSNVMIGADARHQSTPTNFSVAIFTNLPGPLFLAGYGLTFNHFTTWLRKPTPMP